MQAHVQRLLGTHAELAAFLQATAAQKRIEGTLLFLNLREDLIKPTTRLQKYSLLYKVRPN